MALLKNKKRFIAGANCPKCNALDTLFLTSQNAVETLTCINCGFEQTNTPKQAKNTTRQFEQIIGVFDPTE
ncbi:MAG: YheV family putative metal-binding protein [Psychromonas sp.]|nr:YheV family putative metal-binding protein [Psychromonas sp.]